MTRPRLLTILGWLQVVLGVYVPAKLLYGYYEYWGFLKGLASSHPITFIADISEVALIGLLSATAGFMLIRRHRWAPEVAFIAGGIVLVDTVYYFFTTGRADLEFVRRTISTEKYWRISVSHMMDLATQAIRGISWIAALSGVYLPAGRQEFPHTRPETPSAQLLGGMAVSLVVEVLFKAWMWAVWWIDAPPIP